MKNKERKNTERENLVLGLIDDTKSHRILLQSIKGEFTLDAAERLLEWAQGVCIDYILLSLLMNGEGWVAERDGERVFGSTDKAKQDASGKGIWPDILSSD